MVNGNDLDRAASKAKREAEPWLEKLARFGFAAKGTVYILVGGLAAAAALGLGGETTDTSGALSNVADASWGRVLLGLIAVGLAGYVVWRLYSAIADPEDDGAGKRVFYAVTGLIYGGLALEAGRMALDGGSASGGGNSAAHWSARLMEAGIGRVLVGAAGLAVAGYGLQQIWNAWRVDLDDHLDLSSLSPAARTWVVRFGRFGLAARGLVLSLIGGFFLAAAIQADPSEAKGMEGALEMMEGVPGLLAVVALGLVAYGLYNLVRARYRVIDPA